MADIEELVVRIRADASSLEQELRKAQGAVQQSTHHMSGSFGELKKEVLSLVPAVSAVAFAAFVKGAIEATNHLNDLSLRTGAAATTFSALNIPLLKVGSNVDDLAGGIDRLNNALGNAAKGDQGAVKAFDNIGLSVTKLLTLSTDDRLREVSDHLFKKMGDQAIFTNSGVELLGRSFSRFAGVIKESGGDFQKFTENQQKLGNSLTQEQIDQISEFANQWTVTMQQLTLAIDKSGIITYLKHLADGINAIVEGVEAVPGVFRKAARALGMDAPEPTPEHHRMSVTVNPNASGNNDDLLRPKASALEEYIQNLNKETAALGLSQRAYAQQAAVIAAGNAARTDWENHLRASKELTPEEINNVERLSGAFYDLQKAQQENERFAAELKDQFSETTKSIIFDAKNATDAVNRFGQALAEMIIQRKILGPLTDNLFGTPGSSGGGFLSSLFPSFDIGTDYVPRDMMANIHKGEMIIPAGQAASMRSGDGAGGVSIVQNIQINPGVPELITQRIREAAPQIISTAHAAVFASINGGGNAARMVRRHN